jgi:hypothetical protein
VDTLFLDRATWDHCLDASGNVAMVSAPYALAQHAASAIRGQAPPIAAMKAAFVNATLTVPGVVSAVCYIAEIKGRIVTGVGFCRSRLVIPAGRPQSGRDNFRPAGISRSRDLPPRCRTRSTIFSVAGTQR